MAIYMKVGGISGAVTTSGFEGCFALESFQWGFAAAYSGRQASNDVTVREAAVTMKAEKSSPQLVASGLRGSSLKSVMFKFTTTVKDKVDVFLAYELSDALISNYGISGTSDGVPVESLTFSFTKITQTFTARDARLTGSPASVTYDVKSGQVQ